jgi:hypothetical protein
MSSPNLGAVRMLDDEFVRTLARCCEDGWNHADLMRVNPDRQVVEWRCHN